MAKTALKRAIRTKQKNRCALSQKPLSEDTALFDTDRKKQKALNGIYTYENTRALDPVTHMERHGNLRIREERLENLKAVIDDREQMMKLRNKISNQLMAYQRKTDRLNEITIRVLMEQLESVDNILKARSRLLTKTVKDLASVDPLAKAALGVIGVGEVTIGYCMAYIDLNKARHASSLWKYAGLDKPSHKRYEVDKEEEKIKGRGGNKSLRTSLFTMASSQEKNMKGAYRPVYDQVKTRLSISDKIVSSRNTQGKLVEVAWKDAKPYHRQGAALRAIMKHFLADYWFVGRTVLGLPTSPLYAEAILGKEGHKTIDPKSRGWIY